MVRHRRRTSAVSLVGFAFVTAPLGHSSGGGGRRGQCDVPAVHSRYWLRSGSTAASSIIILASVLCVTWPQLVPCLSTILHGDRCIIHIKAGVVQIFPIHQQKSSVQKQRASTTLGGFFYLCPVRPRYFCFFFVGGPGTACACVHMYIPDLMPRARQLVDLGCGWGSLTLFLAEKYPNSSITSISNSASQKAYIDGQCKVRLCALCMGGRGTGRDR